MRKELVVIDEKQAAKLPVATHKGPLQLGDAVISCYVVPIPGQEPKRLMTGRTVTNALGLVGRGPGMLRFLNSSRIRKHMSPELKVAIHDGFRFSISGSGIKPAHGYESWVLPKLCFAIMDANDEEELPAHQQIMLKQAKVLSRAFAIVGIEALVDEATGYQDVRDRQALQRILQQYISSEMQPYIPMFPAEFYQQMFKLLGWTWRGMNVPKPSYVGKLTDDWIYKRLAPGVRDALRGLVPRNEKGHLKHKLHQHLSVEEGRDALAKQIHAVTVLMKVQNNRRKFEQMLNQSLPKYGDTLTMDLDIQELE